MSLSTIITIAPHAVGLVADLLEQLKDVDGVSIEERAEIKAETQEVSDDLNAAIDDALEQLPETD